MQRYSAIVTEYGPCVVYAAHSYLVQELVCATLEVAQREAARMNAEHCARPVRRPSAHYGMRRPVRYFENEDIHG